jgi:hypothetical protein
VRVVDTQGAPSAARGLLLFEAKSGELIDHDILPGTPLGKGLALSDWGLPDGVMRIWLPPGEYAVRYDGAFVPRSIKSGAADLGLSLLRVDGITPVPDVIITVTP